MSDVDTGPAAPPTDHRRRAPWIVVVAVLATVAVMAFAVSQCASDGKGGAPPPTTIDPTTQTAIDDAVAKAVTAQSEIVSRVYQRIRPSVVEIDVDQNPSVTDAPREGSGLGTGVIVNEDGSILTALHVVANVTAIRVVYADGTRTTAQIASADPEHDIAMLQPAEAPSVVVPAVLGSPGAVGLPVVAVGNPLGLDDTTTAGVISALDRSIRGDDGNVRAGLIQFDAAVNPGSSGGPLLNQQGEVIGIVIAIADPTKDGFFIGIGFAVPIGTAVAGGGGEQPPK